MKKLINKNGVTPQSQFLSRGEPTSDQLNRGVVGRRSFLKGLGATGAMLLPASALLVTKAKARSDDSGGKLSRGDASILRFLAAAEILESDLWEQYWELGGNQANDFAATNPADGKKPKVTGGNANYRTALQLLDMDMPQYIQDNTDDEFSHSNFLLAYLKSKEANTADLDLLFGPHFRTLQGSVATGSTKKGTAHEPYETHSGHQFLGAVSLGQQEPRSRRHFIRSGSPDFECRAAHGNSQN